LSRLTIFGEYLLGGGPGVLRGLGFATAVIAATLLGR
jgi:hypothetical protein